MSAQPAAPAFDAQPSPDNPDIGITSKSAVAEELSAALADTYSLILKTHAYHWNVVGPMFHAVHEMTEEQYKDMFEAADDLAERMRALGALAPMDLKAMFSSNSIASVDRVPAAKDMIDDLAMCHEALARTMKRVIEVAASNGDAASEDLATARTAFHEKSGWMLRSLIAE